MTLNCIRSRFDRKQIFTNIGNILICLNSFEWDESLYTSEVFKGYLQNNSQPHIFKIASDTYKNMLKHQKSQSIIVSGESGAGKTETVKLCLDFITFAASRNKKTNTELAKKIVACNPILEAFGNAKTVRNDNSSRFGKWIELKFDSFGSIKAATINNFLLEKSRVTNHLDDEQNFHIFYQLVAQKSKNLDFNLLPK